MLCDGGRGAHQIWVGALVMVPDRVFGCQPGRRPPNTGSVMLLRQASPASM